MINTEKPLESDRTYDAKNKKPFSVSPLGNLTISPTLLKNGTP
jgi:hypothetical protein